MRESDAPELYTTFWLMVRSIRQNIEGDVEMIHETATSDVLKELGIGRSYQGEPYFIGWWSPSETSVGYVGRLVQWLPTQEGEKRKFAYVILPSFAEGVAFNGSFIHPGMERLRDVCSMEDMRRMFTEGLRRLKELVKREGTSDTEGSPIRDLSGAEGSD
jgi:hypothetical protein